MTEREYKNMFAEMDRDELIRVAVLLALDTERLRAELDKAQGVIR